MGSVFKPKEKEATTEVTKEENKGEEKETVTPIATTNNVITDNKETK